MNGDIEKAKVLLPAWFVGRMMTDEWPFGLMTPNGKIIVINKIEDVHQAKDGSIWIDVSLGATFTMPGRFRPDDFISAPTSRTTASINTSHIVCALELADT